MIEALIGGILTAISFYILFIILLGLGAIVATIYEFIVLHWVIIFSILGSLLVLVLFYKQIVKLIKFIFSVSFIGIKYALNWLKNPAKLIISFSFKMMRPTLNWLKNINSKLQPKTILGVRVQMLSSIAIYNLLSFLILQYTWLEVLTALDSIMLAYYFIFPQKYLALIKKQTPQKTKSKIVLG